MFRGLRMALDQLSIMRLLKGKLSKKAVAAQAVEHKKLACHKCGNDHGVTLKKVGDVYVCVHCSQQRKARLQAKA